MGPEKKFRVFVPGRPEYSLRYVTMEEARGQSIKWKRQGLQPVIKDYTPRFGEGFYGEERTL